MIMLFSGWHRGQGSIFFLGNETPTARKAEFRGIGDVGRRRRHDYVEFIKVSWSIPRA